MALFWGKWSYLSPETVLFVSTCSNSVQPPPFLRMVSYFPECGKVSSSHVQEERKLYCWHISRMSPILKGEMPWFLKILWNWQYLIQKTNVPTALLNGFSIWSVQIHFPWICHLFYELHICCILLVDSPHMLCSSLNAVAPIPWPQMRTQLRSCLGSIYAF